MVFKQQTPRKQRPLTRFDVFYSKVEGFTVETTLVVFPWR